ncbi:transglycosylase domain-containing protein [Oceanivirga salmonicida]|uniref:transglycosylase domain-containing protein n=1 Tax=Oceanivirga salmonicida TaxID=1769291 RepID=UPI0012E2AF71|nr:PBP1A family penicillin-binding protein [Oceanivirga salmonicida]
MKKIIRIVLYVIGVGFVLSLLSLTYIYVQVKRKYPVELLENYEPIKPSIIYDINGRQIDVLALENRDPISINEIPLHVQNAFIAVEDKRFRSHHGLDFLRLGKAVYLNVTHTGRQGGSTITQQLVKNAFLTRERSLRRKIEEAVLAVEMERIYTKDEILEYYLNTINFGKGAYGIKNASLKYFGVLPKDLTIGQAAILSGIPKSPTKYSKLENAIERQKIVLLTMYNGGFISKEEYENAKAEEIKFVTNQDLEKISEAEELSNSNLAPEVTTIILKELKEILEIDDESSESLFSGYKIYSTIDINMQKAAYKAFEKDKNLKKYSNLQASLISIDSNNGFVKAIVGGKNFRKGDFNRALYARKQAGSVFKPVVYLEAFKKGYPMNLVLEDSPSSFGRWQPRNYGGRFTANITMLKAMQVSNNIAAVKIMNMLNIKDIKKLWFDSGVKTEDFPNDLTLSLGSITTTPIDLARFYIPLSNGGYKIEPKFVYKIENKYGEVIYEADDKKEKIYDTDSVALLTYMLGKVVENGTARGGKVYKNGNLIPMAGKTGTTSSYVTAWFTGYTPNLVTVVYVGNDDNKSMGAGMSGSRLAVPIWKNYMQAVVNLPNYNVTNFDYIIDGIVDRRYVERVIDLHNGFLDTDGVNSSEALFISGTEPIEKEDVYYDTFKY